MAEPSIAEILEETTERCRNLDAPLAGTAASVRR